MQGRKTVAILTLLFCIQDARSLSRIDPLVDTNIGLIRGLKASDGEYAKFTGIPYATVNESNIFGVAIPHPGFDEVFEAYGDSGICPQIDEFSLRAIGSLDCLNLNVYVPNVASSRNRLPVMVWIYGGGFEMGNGGPSFYGPTYLVQHDIILVTLNYRVGPYGFMSLGTPDVPGNQGLKDQLLALKWVKNNIEAFGGDNDKITIFGESAGGASVDLHLYYSDANLFNKVILQSGTTLTPVCILEPDVTSPIKIANHLGFDTDNVEDALSFVSTSEPKLVIAAADELGLAFWPCVEKDFENVEKFMGVHPINSPIARNDYSILIGHNDDESSVYFRYYKDIDFLRGLINLYLTDYFKFESKEFEENVKLIRHFYMGDKEINEDFTQGIIEFDSDFVFNYPTVRSILKYLDNDVSSVFFYVFSYNGGRNRGKVLANATTGGAAHTDELGYLFSDTYNSPDISPEDQIMINRITTLWTNFAKYGNPTPETTELLPIIWTPVNKETLPYLSLDSELSIKHRPFHSRMAFWDIFYKLNERAQNDYLP